MTQKKLKAKRKDTADKKPPEEKSEKKINKLEQVISSINKKYGQGTILKAGQAPGLVLDRISTGIFALDVGIGGGWPRGRISLLKGLYSSAKTTVALNGLAQAQLCDRITGKPFAIRQRDGSLKEVDFGAKREPIPMRGVVFDAEHTFDPKWAMKWGVDMDEVFVIQAEYAEQGIDVADVLIRSGECDFMLVDSVAALVPSKEIEESAEKWQMGVAARLMNKALRKWTSGLNAPGLLATTKCTILLINQIRLGFGKGGISYFTSPGGKGLDHFESIELMFKNADSVLDAKSERMVGAEIEFTVNKNKTAPMTHGGTFQMYHANSPGNGHKVGEVDNDQQILRAAVYWGLVQKSTSWYSVPSLPDVKAQGLQNFTILLKERPEIIDVLKEKVLERELNWLNTGEAPDASKAKTKGDESEEAQA